MDSSIGTASTTSAAKHGGPAEQAGQCCAALQPHQGCSSIRAASRGAAHLRLAQPASPTRAPNRSRHSRVVRRATLAMPASAHQGARQGGQATLFDQDNVVGNHRVGARRQAGLGAVHGGNEAGRESAVDASACVQTRAPPPTSEVAGVEVEAAQRGEAAQAAQPCVVDPGEGEVEALQAAQRPHHTHALIGGGRVTEGWVGRARMRKNTLVSTEVSCEMSRE
jgi:hypothetical protein